MFEWLRTATELVVIMLTLLAFGGPGQALVQAYGLDADKDHIDVDKC